MAKSAKNPSVEIEILLDLFLAFACQHELATLTNKPRYRYCHHDTSNHRRNNPKMGGWMLKEVACASMQKILQLGNLGGQDVTEYETFSFGYTPPQSERGSSLSYFLQAHTGGSELKRLDIAAN